MNALIYLKPISLTPAGDINGSHCASAYFRALLFVSAIVLDHRFSNLVSFWQTQCGTRETRAFMTLTAFLFRVSTLDGGFLTRIPLCPPSWASSHSRVRQLEQLHVKRPLLSAVYRPLDPTYMHSARAHVQLRSSILGARTAGRAVHACSLLLVLAR